MVDPTNGLQSRAVVTRALLRVGAPAAIGAGVIIVLVGLVYDRTANLLSGGTALALGAWVELQRRRDRPRPLALLVVASIGISAAALLGERTSAVGALPVFSLLPFIGIFTLRRPTAIRLAVWCGLLAIVVAQQLLPTPTPIEMVTIVGSLSTTFFVGFWLIGRADDVLVAEERDLAAALESKVRLLAFEQAIASCSQALLGNAEDPIPSALEALRAAIGADGVYLCLNVDDQVQGQAFRVVNSAATHSTDGQEPSDLIPWSDWPEAFDRLTKGEAYHYRDSSDLVRIGVPIFGGNTWLGSLGVQGKDTDGWSIDAPKLLFAAAPLLATYWERENARLHLEDLVRSKDRFLASVSHEIRTPLSAVLGFAEVLKRSHGSHDQAELTEMLELIATESQDMADLIEDLLVGARADLGTISVQPSAVYLRSQAEAAVVALRSLHEKKVTVTGSSGKSWADGSRIRQILRNLLTNAIRYGGNEIAIEVDTTSRFAMLRIRDSGPALPKDDWERIFEPYQRAHDRPTQTASIGLGLTVSRQLARLMGGDLVYRGEQGGSVFELAVPVANPGLVTGVYPVSSPQMETQQAG